MSAVIPRMAWPDVVRAWVEGWALSRGVAPPTPAYDGLRIDVGLPDHRARYVFASVGDGVRRAASEVLERHVFLKVCAPPAAVAPLLTPGWRLGPPSVMMSTDDLGGPAGVLAEGYSLALDRAGQVLVASCRTRTGELAASGRLALVGSTAVFDRVETHPDHRRRGLGRIIMSSLASQGRLGGAKLGVLVATPDGRALYGAMGWRVLSPYTTALRE